MSRFSPVNDLMPHTPPVDIRDIRALRTEMLELRYRLERVEHLLLAYVGDGDDLGSVLRAGSDPQVVGSKP